MATTKLNWITPLGTIANMFVGSPVEVPVQAYAVGRPGATLTYACLGGNLPPGLTLESDGRIIGIPTYSASSANYFNTVNYNFVVRVRDDEFNTLDGTFTIIVNNIVNSDFAWVTATGDLGTVPNDRYYSLPFEVEESLADVGVTFSFISGELPPGVQVTPGFFHRIARIDLNQTLTTKQDLKVTTAIIVTTAGTHTLYDSELVKFKSIRGTIELNGYRYYAQRLSSTRFALYDDVTLTTPVDSTGYTPYVSGGIAWDTGYLQGVPTLLSATLVNKSQTFNFTIRATNSLNHVTDRSFSLSVTNVYGPVITPNTPTVNVVTNNTTEGIVPLGAFYDGVYFSQQLNVIELNPNLNVVWSSIGRLPPGLTIDSSGKISGYLRPIEQIGINGPSGYSAEVFNEYGIPINRQLYDYGPYDFYKLSQTVYYRFTIQAYDGANYDLQDYSLLVVSRDDATVDNTQVRIDTTELDISTLKVQLPFLLNPATTLPAGRAGSFYAYKFQGYDFQGDNVLYSIASGSRGSFDAYIDGVDAGFDYEGDNVGHTAGAGFNSFRSGEQSRVWIGGLILDTQTGWLYGRLNTQSSSYQTYTFQLTLSKVHGNEQYYSIPTSFTLPVLGDVENVIEWTSPTNVGSIVNGSVSELKITASTPTKKSLVYTLPNKAGIPIRLPQGLKLLPSGELSGRVTFEALLLDKGETTIDGDALTMDRTFTFNVKASTEDGNTFDTKQFTLVLIIQDVTPYETLYLRALPSQDQRKIFHDIINNKSIFQESLIYRSPDSWFGVSNKIEMLFLPGLNPSEANTYATAMVHNHYRKIYTFGEISTAAVLDSNYNIKYEVVYINVIDQGQNIQNQSPPLQLDLSLEITNPYLDVNNNPYPEIVYPNSSINMIERLVQNIGYLDQSSLPDWMTSNQPGDTTGTFKTPLGYTKAVVLAYTVPGAAKLIAYRLKDSGIDFNNIEFAVDRFFLDDYLTSNYNITAESYYKGSETTFDIINNVNSTIVAATVEYGASIPFDQINGRSVNYINQVWGGIDGITDFKTGDKLLFLQQEGFPEYPNQGWQRYSDKFIGDSDITIYVEEGYDSEAYDAIRIIPGYIEKEELLLPWVEGISITQVQEINGEGYLTLDYPTNTILPGSYLVVPLRSDGAHQPLFGGLEDLIIYNVVAVVDEFTIIVSHPTRQTSFTEQQYNGNGIRTSFSGLNSSTLTESLIVATRYRDKTYTGTGIQTVFGGLPISTTTVRTVVTVNNARLIQNTDYTVSGTNITFTTAPAAGKEIIVRIFTNFGNSNNILRPFIDYNVVGGTTLEMSAAVENTEVIDVKIYTSTGGNQFTNATGSVTSRIYSNQRAAVWEMTVYNNVVTLFAVQEIRPGEHVNIVKGKTWAGSTQFYDQKLSSGQTAPKYSPYKYKYNAVTDRTTFNGDSTRFISHRDQYYAPGSNDKYLKFPQYGVFN